MKLYLIDPHDKRLYRNGIFDIKVDKYFIVWQNIRKYLQTKNIILDTIDLHPVEKADKIFFFDHQAFTMLNYGPSPYLKQCIIKNIPKIKLNLIITECPIIKPESWSMANHQYYNKVYTWNDSLIDNKKYFKYRWLQNTEFREQTKTSFHNKKFLTLINAHKTNYLQNELYSLRTKIIRYFEKYHPYDFDLYGVGWNHPLSLKFAYSAIKSNPFKIFLFIKDYFISLFRFKSYRGSIGNKLSVLSRYKYSICFENMTNIEGYITEKIFDCFKANCVPVYFGATNIDQYIPPSTFIDFRRFNEFDEMYNYLTKIDEKAYNKYLTGIKLFLKSDKFKRWGFQSFCNQIFLKY